MKIRQSKFTRTQGKGLASSPKTPWQGGREGRTDRQTDRRTANPAQLMLAFKF